MKPPDPIALSSIRCRELHPERWQPDETDKPIILFHFICGIRSGLKGLSERLYALAREIDKKESAQAFAEAQTDTH